MSLIRQMWLVVVLTVVVAFVGSFAVTMVSARSYVETQLKIKNSDNAGALALALSQHKGDPGMIELLVSAQFDTGFYQRIRYVGTDGRTIDRQATPVDAGAPQWFVALLPIRSEPGVAQVSDGWRALGSVEVISHASFAYADLWRGGLRAGMWLALVGLVAGVIGNIIVRSIRRPLRSAVDQAQALVNRQFVTVREPRVPELQRLTRAMNSMVHRLKQVFEEQTEQLESLRVQANCDPATGVSHRRHFMTSLQIELEREDAAPQGVLVMTRLLDLAGLNQALGRREADHLIQVTVEALKQFAAGYPGTAIGRLNGPDFAAYLPGQTDAHALATSLARAMQVAHEPFGPRVDAAFGAMRFERGMGLSQLLAGTDAALARAEAQGRYAVQSQGELSTVADTLGQEAWKRRIDAALAQGAIRLQRYPVIDREGGLLHHECPVRIQLEPQGDYAAASLWLPLALRTQTTAAVDLAGVRIALAEIAREGAPLGLNLSLASVADPRFSNGLRELLAGAGASASSLWLELPEAAAVQHQGLVREVCQLAHQFGARFGLEHAGEQLARIDRLYELGLDFIKLDARFVRGSADDQATRSFVQGAVQMVHALGIAAYAEGVSTPEDIAALWECGIDGVTGPAVQWRDGGR